MSCPAILSGYSNDCRDAQGGVKKFYVTEKANIASYTEASGVCTNLTMVSGKKFWLFEQEVEVANFTEAPTPSRQNGTHFWDKTFNCSFLKRGASLSYSLRALGQQDLVIIHVEETGTNFVSGLVRGMALEPSNSMTGTTIDNKNGYDCVFKTKEPHGSYTLSQSILDTIIV